MSLSSVRGAAPLVWRGKPALPVPPPPAPEGEPPRSPAGQLVGGLAFGVTFGVVAATSVAASGDTLGPAAAAWVAPLVVPWIENGTLDLGTAVRLAQWASQPAVGIVAAGCVAGAVGFAVGAWLWREL